MISHAQRETQLIHKGHHRCRTYGGRNIDCLIRIIEHRWNTVVVATDISDDIFSSITVHTDEVATAVCNDHNLDPAHVLWIEHIPADVRFGREEDLYDLVHFTAEAGMLTKPHWTPLTEEEVYLLTGGHAATMPV